MEVARTARTGRPFSVVFVDLDHFKQVNDRFGHQAGSTVLKEVGDLIRQKIRTIDVPVRYGGDEFVVLLPETDKAHARRVADRIRVALCEATFLQGSGLEVKVTASFGLATCPDDGETPETIVQGADAAMYRVKAASRNAVG
jgi:diguanylate cyclase (GGDEF)-like protein